jgi:hypothetical protein
MLKKILSKFISPKQNVIKSLKYFSSFDPKFVNLIEISSVYTPKNDISSINFNDFRIKGIRFSLRYYDSHLYHNNIKYDHSILPTLFVLPNGESKIEDLTSLIDFFSHQNYRILVMEFPGL